MRNYTNWKDRNQVLGKPSADHIDEGKRKSQREKFCKCRKCGGQMTYVPGTNTLVCNCEVVGKDGKTRVCGNINIVDDRYMSYVNYLFA